MLISYNWLKELLPDLGEDPVEVSELLTLHAFETEVSHSIEIDQRVVVAKIIKLEKHPNADRLRLATVDTGAEALTVVCGAPNISEGDVVPFSPPGTDLRDPEGNTFTLSKTTIRGVESPGMLNSLRELGLSHDHSGIWILPDAVPVGSALVDHFPSDTVLEIDMTPNRAHDAMSHIGVAREVAAILGLTTHEPELPKLPESSTDVDGITVEVTDTNDCPRFIGVVLDDLRVAPSPLWLQARLLAVGAKPINNLVDITNYVTFEYGNPTHLFDRTAINGKTLGVRRAHSGEQLHTLDDKQRTLMSEDTVVTVDDRPASLAGIVGGGEDEVGSETTQGFFEVANWRPFMIQETSRRQTVRTEASVRFSKGLHPNLAGLAARRGVQLLQELCGASVRGVLDAYPEPWGERTVSLHPQRIAGMAGVPISIEDAKDALTRLRFGIIERSDTEWQTTVPPERLDIAEEHDLIEEVIRLFGLNTIEAPELADLTPQPLPSQIYWREVVRDVLLELGLSEAYNSSFEPEHYAQSAGVEEAEHIEVVNPPAPDLARLRVSLLPGLFANLTTNRALFERQAGHKESALFEIGPVYRPGEGGRVPGVIEREHVAGVIVGGMPELATIADLLSERLGVPDVTLANVLTSQIQRSLKYHKSVVAFEVDLEDLIGRVERDHTTTRALEDIKQDSQDAVMYEPISRFPAVYRDVSFLVGADVTVEQVQDVLDRAGGELLVDTDLFDEYQPADSDKKSLAFHLTYQAMDRTLSDDEVSEVHNALLQTLKDELSADLRD